MSGNSCCFPTLLCMQHYRENCFSPGLISVGKFLTVIKDGGATRTSRWWARCRSPLRRAGRAPASPLRVPDHIDNLLLLLHVLRWFPLGPRVRLPLFRHQAAWHFRTFGPFRVTLTQLFTHLVTVRNPVFFGKKTKGEENGKLQGKNSVQSSTSRRAIFVLPACLDMRDRDRDRGDRQFIA